jgi:integrase
MPRKGKPQTIAPLVYAYPTRIRALAKHGTRVREKAYPLGTDLAVMQRWQLRTKAELMADTPLVAPGGESLAAAFPRYLATLVGKRRLEESGLARHWLNSPLATMDRATIVKSQIKAQMATWQTAGHAANSINHRVRVLRNVYNELDGEDATHPTDGIKRLREPDPVPRDQPYALLLAIIAWMPDHGHASTKGQPRGKVNLTKARALVMLWTGLPPALLKQVYRVHFNRAAATLAIPSRKKGLGTKPKTIPLLPPAVDALQAFFDAGAAGPFNTSAFYKVWQSACARCARELRKLVAAQGGDPATVVMPHIRPYDIRHSFGSEAWRQTGDMQAVKQLMIHAVLATTERYTVGVVEEAAQRAVTTWAAQTRA